MHGFGQDDAAGLGVLLQARRDVDRIPEDAPLRHEDLALVNRDAQRDRDRRGTRGIVPFPDGALKGPVPSRPRPRAV